MGHLSLSATPLAGLNVLQRKRTVDSRGFFSRFFCSDELAQAGFELPIAQINHTLTRRRGAARGMHFQHPPHAEVKLVSCLRGTVFDVAVDLRQGSETFLQWHGEMLSDENARSLLIPRGFAHGFQAMTDDCELIYLHSCAYAPGAEGALHMRDPSIDIHWPLAFADVSDRDTKHPFITDEFTGLKP